MSKEYTLRELNFDGEEVVEEDGFIWKEILKAGKWETTPGPGQKPVDRPFIVNHRGDTVVSDDSVTLSLESLVEAYEDGAIDHVTVPESHEDSLLENTGFVRKLRIDGEGDEAKLMAAIDFTEPDIGERAKRGSIPNTSCGILFDYMRKQDKKTYPAALAHVALTPRPWINGMEPFGTQLSEELPDGQEIGEILAFSQVTEGEATEEDTDSQSTEEVAEEDSVESDMPDVSAEDTELDEEEASEKSPLELAQQDRRTRLALADEESATPITPEGGEEVMEDEKKVSDLELKLSEAEERAKQAEERARTAEQRARKADVEKRIVELSEQGLEAFPGFLAEARRIMLSDDGGPAVLLLSEEEGKEATEATATEIVENLIGALPKTEDDRFDLSEQALVSEDTGKPDEGSDEKPLEERVTAAQDFLGV